MKYIYIYSFLLFFSCSFIGNAQIQTPLDIKHKTLQTDSIASEKGQLQLLTQRIYLAFKAYTTGMTGLTLKYEKPIVLKYHEDFNQSKPMEISELEKIPIDSIEAIEAVYEPKYRGLLYGELGQRCIIIVKLKSK